MTATNCHTLPDPSLQLPRACPHILQKIFKFAIISRFYCKFVGQQQASFFTFLQQWSIPFLSSQKRRKRKRQTKDMGQRCSSRAACGSVASMDSTTLDPARVVSVLVVGLDNAGKTSVGNRLQGSPLVIGLHLINSTLHFDM